MSANSLRVNFCPEKNSLLRLVRRQALFSLGSRLEGAISIFRFMLWTPDAFDSKSDHSEAHRECAIFFGSVKHTTHLFLFASLTFSRRHVFCACPLFFVKSQKQLSPTDEFYRAVGLRIRTERDRARLTQEELAGTLGLTRTSVTNIERGRQRLLLHTLRDISVALGCQMQELFPPAPDPKGNLKLDSSVTESEADWIKRTVGN